jgi:tetratricopeptide (TPR) repeat protein
MLAAAKGDEALARQHLETLNAIAAKVPASYVIFGNALHRGKVAYLLGKFTEAHQAFSDAYEAGSHPIHWHEAAYWRGTAAMKAGDFAAARDSLQRVIADSFATWMHAEAESVLRSLSGKGEGRVEQPDFI